MSAPARFKEGDLVRDRATGQEARVTRVLYNHKFPEYGVSYRVQIGRSGTSTTCFHESDLEASA